MIARGFKPVGWAAAVGAAALCCYMLSLNVAAERAELDKIERQIIAAKQDIRTLQTELGTRGRLTQLEQWNAEVLALSAPGSNQFLPNAFRLASFAQPQRGSAEVIADVRLASADAAAPDAAVKTAVATRFEAPAEEPREPVLRRASLVTSEAPVAAPGKPALVKAAAIQGRLSAAEPIVKKEAAASASPKKRPMIDAGLLAEISDAARAERSGNGGAGGR